MAKSLIPGREYVTVAVFGAAYRGRSVSARALLTHLADAETEEGCCRVQNLTNRHDHTAEETQARPTCLVCAKKWDKLHA